MNVKALAGSAVAVGLLGLGMLAGSVVGSGGASAQTSSGSATTPAQVATTANPSSTQSPSTPPGKGNPGSTTITAKLTQQPAEQAALAASPGSTIDHTILQDQNGTPVYDVDFTNGGGVLVNGDTGAVITVEAAGQDHAGPGGHGGFGGHRGGADQSALASQAKVTQQQAEQAALTASPGNTVDHSILQDQNGTVVWDVDFTNGGGVIVNAVTGSVVQVEAAGTDQGGHPQAPSTSTTPTTQP